MRPLAQPLADVGARLREARERRGLALEALASATKIPLTALTAIERNDIARLPGGLYTRGYIRAYAAEVGLNPDASTTEYLAQFEMPPTEEPVVPQGVDLDRPFSRVPLVAALAFGVGLLAYGLMYFRRSPEATPAAPPADAGPAESAPAVPLRDIPTTALATSERPALQLELETHDTCWVSVRADGRVAVFKLMRGGERALVEADDTIVLHVGDAGALTYRINGAPGRPLGRPGDVVTVSITQDTYETFVAEAAAAAPAG